jgi:Ca2+-binding EF-hand superfamily protein
MAKDISTSLAAGLLGLALGLGGTAVFAASPAPTAAPDDSAPSMPQGMPYQPSIEQVFEMLDGDHDGIVTLAEALQGVVQHFDMVDQNKDGILDKAEFESWFGRANPDAARFFLTLYDLDGDGKVTKAEFENPVKKRFALFDRNDDGRVTPDELRFARMLMAGGPTALLVPPMSPPVEPPPPTPPVPLRNAQPMPAYPTAPAPTPQYLPPSAPQGGQQTMGQPVPRSLVPPPGVYGPGGQSWNQPSGPMRPMYPSGNGPMYPHQGPMR